MLLRLMGLLRLSVRLIGHRLIGKLRLLTLILNIVNTTVRLHRFANIGVVRLHTCICWH